jgi:hypothetical protein
LKGSIVALQHKKRGRGSGGKVSGLSTSACPIGLEVKVVLIKAGMETGLAARVREE